MEIKIYSKKYGEKIVAIDEQDYELINGMTIGIRKGKRTFYATVYDRSKKRSIKIHSLLLNVTDDYIVDHIDNNGLNNQRSNLREATNKNNTRNRVTPENNHCGFKGVHFVPLKKLFVACIRVDGKLIYGGRYKSVFKAALKYNELAVKHFGEFANLNILTSEQEELSRQIFQRNINKNNLTGYRGVSISKNGGKKPYFATIYVNGKNKHIGTFEKPQEAALAYNEAAIKHFGVTAFLNKIF